MDNAKYTFNFRVELFGQVVLTPEEGEDHADMIERAERMVQDDPMCMDIEHYETEMI